MGDSSGAGGESVPGAAPAPQISPHRLRGTASHCGGRTEDSGKTTRAFVHFFTPSYYDKIQKISHI